MTTNKFAALEAFMSTQGISQSELIDWANGCGKEIIPTELPVVYRQGTELIVENGLDLSRRSEVWGIQLLSGVTLYVARVRCITRMLQCLLITCISKACPDHCRAWLL